MRSTYNELYSGATRTSSRSSLTAAALPLRVPRISTSMFGSFCRGTALPPPGEPRKPPPRCAPCIPVLILYILSIELALPVATMRTSAVGSNRHQAPSTFSIAVGRKLSCATSSGPITNSSMAVVVTSSSTERPSIGETHHQSRICRSGRALRVRWQSSIACVGRAASTSRISSSWSERCTAISPRSCENRTSTTFPSGTSLSDPRTPTVSRCPRAVALRVHRARAGEGERGERT